MSVGLSSDINECMYIGRKDNNLAINQHETI